MTTEFIPGDFVRVFGSTVHPSPPLGVVLGTGTWYLSETRAQVYVTVLVASQEGSMRWNVRPERLELANDSG